MAPSRRDVAIACSPATPAPSTSTRAGRMVPAGVVSMGKKRPSADGGHERGAVAGDRGLRGERVHRLGPGDTRQQLEREGGDATVAQQGDLVEPAGRLQEPDHDLPGAQQLDLGGLRVSAP